MTERNSHITTIYPIAGGNGSAFTTIQLARALREKEKYAKIAVVDFDFASPVLGEGLHDDDAHGIDMLVDKINGDILTTDSFLENMVELKNDIHLLRGTKLGHRFPFVGQEHLEPIIKFLREEYDYVFIATSDEITDGGTGTALYHADTVVVVGRYTQKNQYKIKDAISAVENYVVTKNIALIYNQYNDQNKLEFSNSLPDHWDFCGTVPFDNGAIDNHQSIAGGFSFGRGKEAELAKETYNEIFGKFLPIEEGGK